MSHFGWNFNNAESESEITVGEPITMFMVVIKVVQIVSQREPRPPLNTSVAAKYYHFAATV